MLAGVKRKYPRTESVFDNVSVSTSYPKGAVKLDLQFGGEVAGRSLVKTAVAFAHYNGISVETCNVARSYLRKALRSLRLGTFMRTI